jgi:hypothetical protein
MPDTRALLCVWYIQINIKKRLRLIIQQYILVYLEIEGDVRREINARWQSAKELFN